MTIEDTSPPDSGTPDTRSTSWWGGTRGQLVAVVLGVVFLIIVGYVAITSFTEDRRGEQSPEAAVHEFVEALNSEDVIAAVSILAPSEVGSFGDLYPRIVELAVVEGALESEDWLTGVDFELVDLETSVVELHPGVALVELRRGTLSMAIDPEAADPVFADSGDLESSITIQRMRDEMQDGIDNAAEDVTGLPFSIRAPDGIFLMTINRGDGWFVSPFYTAAEYGRQILDLPPADFTASRENSAPGAQTPTGVISDLVSMANDYQLEDHFEVLFTSDPGGIYEPLNVFLPPDELGVLLDYGPSFTAWMEQIGEELEFTAEAAEEFSEEIRESFDVRGEVSVSVEIREEPRDDGDVVLYLESGSIRMDAVIVDLTVGETMEVELDASWNGMCGQGSLIINDESLGSVDDCVPDDALPEGFNEVFVVVTEVDGDWYISYVETILAYAEIFISDQLKDCSPSCIGIGI